MIDCGCKNIVCIRGPVEVSYKNPQEAEKAGMSAKASSIAVTRKGAVPSIPYKKEVLESL